MVITIRVHWIPSELEIEKRGKAELIQMVITIGVHRSWRLRGEAELIQMVITIGAHWSPLELEIEKRGEAKLIQNRHV
jgi:hypothetical protein